MSTSMQPRPSLVGLTPPRDLERLAAAYGGIAVLGAISGSPAARVGIRYGDILLEVNGVPVTTVDDYLAARELRDDHMELRLVRDGRELTLSLSWPNSRAA
jgi:serine protease DegQ